MCAPLITAARNCTKISARLYAPELYAKFRTKQGGLRGRHSTGHEESEIDKAHVLHAAESPWLEVSTVGLSCRLLIAGTMQQMALIAIPTPVFPLSNSPSPLSCSLTLYSIHLSSVAPAVFLASFLASFLPADSTSP